MSLWSCVGAGNHAAAQVSPQSAPGAAAPDSATAGEEPAGNTRQWVNEIASDLIAEKFDDLDRMARQYRLDQSRLRGGEWRLRYFYEVLDAPQKTDQDTVDHLEHLRHWMAARPESITARVALATSLSRWAWVARGNGMAETVTPEGWRLFGQRMAEARTVLEGSSELHEMCPQWYSVMMAVGVAQGWDRRHMQETFARGVQFAPNYYYLYRQMANYLLPKWYGKEGDSATFARDSADKLGGDSGDELYYQIVAVLVKRGDGNFPVEQLDWARVQRGQQQLESQYGRTRGLDNQLAFMAYKFKDAAVAQRQFALIGDDWAPGVWRQRAFFDRVRDWSRGHQQWP